MAASGENIYKVRAYRRAAATIRTVAESVDALVRQDSDLTVYTGIGTAIAGAIAEIVRRGALGQLERRRSEVSPEVAALTEYPRLDPARVRRIYSALRISTVPELKAALERGAIREKLGARLEDHVRRAMGEAHAVLIAEADEIVPRLIEYIREKCGGARVEAAGEFRRRAEVVSELSFLVETKDFAATAALFQQYSGGIACLRAEAREAQYRLSTGLEVRLEAGTAERWGLELIAATGAEAHLEKLAAAGHTITGPRRAAARFEAEDIVYKKWGLAFVPPELREGRDEVELAAAGALPALVTVKDIRGELHAHTTSSDGANTIPEMAGAAAERGYEYIGITDHSQSLKIAGGVTVEDLWKQIRAIDRWNARSSGVRVLKSAEVDILVDGRLDYPDDLLRELDYTVCSIHSRFSLNREQQTERIMRAMDHRQFNILGHATGRLLLRRPGYELDFERLIAHARAAGCFFEINASPDRLDISSEVARAVRLGGAPIAICTDAHSISELEYIRGGVDQARRAGCTAADVLNARPWAELEKLFRR